ncbi:MAG: serine O-acetyltransferase [Verrucomicrobiota bacterium]|jgi:serine O-acetyltransferase|nr:serine O-acetyltransferase [Verrucomicrobiota bacterium]MDK2963936.1 serine O-acetyltransferase [Verrucomicrobiota bacterium]
MKNNSSVTGRTADALAALYASGHDDRPENVLWNYPAASRVVEALKILIHIMFPEMAPSGTEELKPHFAGKIAQIALLLRPELERAIPFRWMSASAKHTNEPPLNDIPAEADRVLDCFFAKLPYIREMLIDDVKAAYNGDPAALSYAEVKLAYPGLLAITSHRIAHELYRLNTPIIPRIMNEWTHAKAGIDIHPGATIGRGFFIDHGTGVVIGETARIGETVKIYQGVTLGAKSFPLDEHGNPIKHVQRHPTVEDHVIIYANTTVLGGKTIIGHHSVVGGNVFLLDSVPPHSFVTKTGDGVIVRTKDTTGLLGGLGI